MMQHGAYVQAMGPVLLDPLAEIATRNGFEIHRQGSNMVIDAPLGRVSVDAGPRGTRLTLWAKTAPELQLLTDLYAKRLEDLAPDATIAWDSTDNTVPLNQVVARVLHIERLSPSFARMRLSGNFETFLGANVGLHFRFLLCRENNDWPTLDEGGRTQWPGGVGSWHRPPYTVRRMSPLGDWIDVDIVLHAGGRVTAWCDEISPGDQVALHGPSGSKQPKARWLGLLGDETALPVILRIIEDAPAGTRGEAVIATRHADDIQAIQTQSAIRLRWVDMADTESLLTGLKALHPAEENRYVFFAAERDQAMQARTFFPELGLKAHEGKAAAYWTKTPH
ncbi:MAG: siderophore-interacting protein [Pseudomonadota bacterium]